MMFVLTLLMLPRIVTVSQAIAGFSNEGLLTVVVLFVVAGGISQTGGLDWYMGKILGRPKTLAGETSPRLQWQWQWQSQSQSHSRNSFRTSLVFALTKTSNPPTLDTNKQAHNSS